MPTYKIIRFFHDDDSVVVETGLTLDQAQAHCRREDTHGDGWFEGYETDDEFPNDVLGRIEGEVDQ